MVMIQMLQEVTEWEEPVYNGIYHVNGAGHLVAYENSHGLTTFKLPMKRFSKTGRKFKKIGERSEELASDTVEVQGSNGKVYYVTEGKCSCPGFTFRGNCKHIQ